MTTDDYFRILGILFIVKGASTPLVKAKDWDDLIDELSGKVIKEIAKSYEQTTSDKPIKPTS